MKIVHSWIPVKGINKYDDQKWFYTMTLLSVLASKQSFGNIHLVTTKDGKKDIEKLKIPYDSISTELEGKQFTPRNYSLGKLDAHLVQDEPYLHIDNDTFLFESRIIPEWKRFSFGFPDVNYPLTMESVNYLYETYINPYNSVKEYFDNKFFHETAFEIIPNCSIMGGNDIDTIKSVYKEIGDLFEYDSEGFLEKTKYTSHLLEQFLFFPMAEAITKDSKSQVFNNSSWINENCHIWSQNIPLRLESGKCLIHGDHLCDYNFINKFYKGFDTWNYDSNLKLLVDNWFGGFCHLGDLSRDVVVRSLFYEKLKKYYDYEESMNEIQKQYENTQAWETSLFSTLI